MTLDFLQNGSLDCPLVRLYDFDTADVSELIAVFTNLSEESDTSVALHNLEFIDALDHCQLTLSITSKDFGLRYTGDTATFECALTPATWDNVKGLCEALVEHRSVGFQWLIDEDIPLLLSRDGAW